MTDPRTRLKDPFIRVPFSFLYLILFLIGLPYHLITGSIFGLEDWYDEFLELRRMHKEYKASKAKLPPEDDHPSP